jgi:hypothetical protein
MTGKQIEYTSVPYKSILAYSIETSGSIDTDQELKLYAHGIGKLSIDLVKSMDVMPIYRFLNLVIIQGEKMAGKNADGAVVFDNSAQKADPSSTGFFDVVGSNYAQIDNQMVEASLKNNPDILLDDEKVELAFKCGRDSFILTSHRLLKIDGQGITGKKGEIFNSCSVIMKKFIAFFYCVLDHPSTFPMGKTHFLLAYHIPRQ